MSPAEEAFVRIPSDPATRRSDMPERAEGASRRVRLVTRGVRAGPVVRLIDPSGLGELLKPFVFLDLADIPHRPGNGFGWHPHSGIATLTVIIDGENEYRETTGVHGGLKPGGIEWMAAGRGVWHSAKAVEQRNLQGFQVWMLLPPGEDAKPPASRHFVDADVPRQKGARVLLGEWRGLSSPVPARLDATLLDVSLKPATSGRSPRSTVRNSLGWQSIPAPASMATSKRRQGISSSSRTVARR